MNLVASHTPVPCMLATLLFACSSGSSHRASDEDATTDRRGSETSGAGVGGVPWSSNSRMSGGATQHDAAGGSSGHSDPQAVGGSHFAAGSDSASRGGVAGAAGTQALAVAGNAGNAGNGGGAAGSVATSPSLPMPTHDCRADTHENCISIAGFYEGVPIDVFCNETAAVQTAVHAGKWVIGCDSLGSGLARIYVPIQTPGTLAETVAAGTASRSEFEFAANGTDSSVTLFAGNFVSAELRGGVVVTSAPYRVVSGTFHALWSTPDSACTAFAGSRCAEARLNVTFRLSTRYGSCFSNSDCKAPLTCNLVGYACYNM